MEDDEWVTVIQFQRMKRYQANQVASPNGAYMQTPAVQATSCVPGSIAQSVQPQVLSQPQSNVFLVPQQPTWRSIPTANVIQQPHPGLATTSMPVLIQSATGMTAGADTMGHGISGHQPQRVTTTPPPSLTSTPKSGFTVSSGLSNGGFSFTQPSSGVPPAMHVLSSEPNNTILISEPYTMNLSWQNGQPQYSFEHDITLQSGRSREPRPRQETCACDDNSCVANRNKSNGLTRNHYSCKTATQILMKWIEDHPENPYPDRDEKKRLAMDANMTVKQLADWFGNARRRRKRMQEDDDHMANREREIREATMRDQ